MGSAFCVCAGFSRFVESTCVTIFSAKEILEVMMDKAVPAYVKAEYCRFFTNVYVQVCGEGKDGREVKKENGSK